MKVESILKTETILITPEWARDKLAHNSSNRAIRKSKVKKYSNMLRNNRWRLNGETICIDEDGNLRNGQHRLTACVLTGIPFYSLVVFNVPKEDATVYDIGTKRTSPDIVKLSSGDERLSNKVVSSATKLHLSYLAGREKYDLHINGESNLTPSEDEIACYILKNGELWGNTMDIVGMGANNNLSKKTACVLACYYALNSKISPNHLIGFYSVLNSGFPDGTNQSSALMIRNNLAVSGNFKSGSIDTVKQICFAISDFNKKEHYKKYDISKSVPYMTGVINAEKEVHK